MHTVEIVRKWDTWSRKVVFMFESLPKNSRLLLRVTKTNSIISDRHSWDMSATRNKRWQRSDKRDKHTENLNSDQRNAQRCERKNQRRSKLEMWQPRDDSLQHSGFGAFEFGFLPTVQGPWNKSPKNHSCDLNIYFNLVKGHSKEMLHGRENIHDLSRILQHPGHDSSST